MKFSVQNLISLHFIIMRLRDYYKSIINDANACTFTLKNCFDGIWITKRGFFPVGMPKMGQINIKKPVM